MKNRILPAMTRFYAILLCCFFAMNVQTMQAQTIVHNVQYLSYNPTAPGFDVLTAEDCIPFTSNTSVLYSAWYVVNSNVTVEDRIYVYGSANIILCDGATLTAGHGIVVQYDHSLNIYCQAGGTGTLNALPVGQAPGIGTDAYANNNLGTISFHGGNITASSGEWSAGIGGGICSGGGTINMYGGNISATGSRGDARSIGRGSNCDGVIEVDRFIATGMCVRVNGGSTPVLYENRINALTNQTASVRQCTNHSGTDHCIYCGALLQGDVTHTYDGNNETGGNVPAIDTYEVGATVTVVGNTGGLERTGYTYAEWNTRADGMGMDYAVGQTYTIGHDVIFYAKWIPITYTVHFDKNAVDATGTIDDMTFTYDKEQKLPASGFSRPGYVFAGWSSTSDGNVEYTNGASVSNLSDGQGDVVTLYAQWMPSLVLVGNADNNDAIANAAATSETYAVVLADYTIYRGDNWNTICLPFDLNDFTGTLFQDATVKTLESSAFNDGELTMTFEDATTIEAGKPYIVQCPDLSGAVLFIRTEEDWNAFAANVNNGTESYEGKTVKLATDISVSTMVGNSSHGFKGTFNGCGHTLTFNYTSGEESSALFRYIDGATIKNLRVAGTLSVSLKFAGGIVSRSRGFSTIENCQSSIVIDASINGDASHGGIVGITENDGTLNLINCLFDGSITGSRATNCAGFLGWRNGGTVMFQNCLMAGTMDISLDANSAIFSRNGQATYTNCYYTGSYSPAAEQGIPTDATGTALQTLLGDGWEVFDGNVVPKMDGSTDMVIIRSEEDWNTFAHNVTNGISYRGKTVKLAADISVSTVAGDEYHAFRGTFNGCGHTITLALSGGNEDLAPFTALADATIQNLKLEGTITYNFHRPASITSYVEGNTTIRNCWSNVDIISNYTGSYWVDGGALVACVKSNAILNLSDCLFTGTVSYHPNNYEGGGMVGWTRNNATANLRNCLFMPSDLALSIPNNDTYIFVTGYVRGNLTNCYYNALAGSSVLQNEGTDATGMSSSDLLAVLGDQWELVDENVVPKMPNTFMEVVDSVFVGVIISDATNNVTTTYADLIGNYAPFTGDNYILDAHNPDSNAIHAAISTHVTAPTGQTLEGWYEDNDLTIPVTTIPFTTDGSVTMYAKWIPLTYTVRFDPNGDNVTGTMDDMDFTYDEPQNLTTNDFRRPCYNFLGWSTTSGGAVEYTDEQSFNDLTAEQGEEIVLYAQWQHLTVEVSTTSIDASYCMNAATVTDLSVSITGGEGTPTYQWYRNGSAISGATTDTYTPLADAGGDYDYSVKVFNDCGGDSIHIANIHIFDAVDVTADIVTPSNLCPNQGSYPVSVTVNGGTPNYSYVWSGDATPVDADETSVNQIGDNDSEQEYTVTVDVTDQNGCATTATANFTVNPSVKKPSSLSDIVCPADLDITMDYGVYDTLLTLSEPTWTSNITTMPLELEAIGVTGNNRYAVPEGQESATYTIYWHLKDTCGGDSLICTQQVTVRFPDCSPVLINDVTYETVRLGANCWLRTNIAVEPEPLSRASSNGAYKYNNDENLFSQFGYLYTWYAACHVPENDNSAVPAVTNGHVKGICPDGWALPTVEDYIYMVEASGGVPHIKIMDNEFWVEGTEGVAPSSTFDAKGAGFYNSYSTYFEGLRTVARFWTITPTGSSVTGTAVQCTSCGEEIMISPKADGYSIRCIKVE